MEAVEDGSFGGEVIYGTLQNGALSVSYTHLQSLPGSRMVRILPFKEISALPRYTASTVT